VQQYPKSAFVIGARVGLGRCAEAMGQTKDAIQLYQEAIAAASSSQAQSAFWAGEASTRIAMLTRNQEKTPSSGTDTNAAPEKTEAPETPKTPATPDAPASAE
jgi:hypothetical protein